MTYLVTALLILNSAPAMDNGDVRAQIREVAKGAPWNQQWDSISDSNPDYPIIHILKGYLQDQNASNENVIKIYEPLMEKIYFNVSVHNGAGQVRDYRFWRDMFFVVLARAHYELGD